MRVERHGSFNVRGQPADAAYCIGSGNAKVVQQSAQGGKESIVRIATPGEMLGYRCLFSEDAFRATGLALEPVGACRVDRALFLELIEKEPSFTRTILKRMGNHISEAENRHHSFVQRSSRERLAEALLLLKASCGTRVELGWQLNIHLTRMELASWIGVAKETVVRCLTDFREEGLISDPDSEDSLLIITHLAGLEKAASLSQLG